jgi:hypothetical protein
VRLIIINCLALPREESLLSFRISIADSSTWRQNGILVAGVEGSKRLMGFNLVRMHEKHEQSHLEDVYSKGTRLREDALI